MGRYGKIAKSDFQFMYKVTYTSPNTGKQWKVTMTSGMLEDILYSDTPKVKILDYAKWYCKKYGTKLN